MTPRPAIVAVVFAAAALGGCAMMRGQESVGSFVDDASITTTVKSRMVEDRTVDAQAIKVETANGAVVLSGIARTSLEKTTVGNIAIKVPGVKTLQNDVAVRP